MTFFIPTTTVSILSGDPTTDEWGDPVDNNTASATGVPASILEQTERVFLPSENRVTEVSSYIGRLRANVSIDEGDRLYDERNGDYYAVREVRQQQSPFNTQSKRLVLARM